MKGVSEIGIIEVASWITIAGFIISLYLVYITQSTKKYLNAEELKARIEEEKSDIVYTLRVYVSSIKNKDYEKDESFSDIIQSIKYFDEYRPILRFTQKYYIFMILFYCKRKKSNQRKLEIHLSSLAGTIGGKDEFFKREERKNEKL